MAKKKDESKESPKSKTGFQKMIQAAKEDRSRLVFDKKIVNK